MIGRTCRGVPPREAAEYIAGYTIGNDFGLHDFRDTDAGSMLRVKGSDTMAPLGPGLVTGWDFRGKRLRTYVNGTLAQDGSTDEMQWDMHYLVADIARTITLCPGDVLLSGTPANSRPVQPGDVVEVEVDGLGRLRNHVVAGPLPVPGRGRRAADGERGGRLHRARRGLGVPRHPAADRALVPAPRHEAWPRCRPREDADASPRMCLILSENWTMTCGRDLPRLVRWAREAEDAGFDSVMISEHIVLGPAAGAERAHAPTPASTRCPATRTRPRRGRARWCCCPRSRP